MSFGFAVGDFIAVGKLVYDISDFLKTASCADKDYQKLLKTLELLEKALHHLETLRTGPNTSQDDIDSIKYAVAACKAFLEDFLKQCRKYDAALGVRSQIKPFEKVKKKLQ